MNQIKLYMRKRRLNKSFKRLSKAEKKRRKAYEFRKWVEDNPEINIVNYPYHRLKKAITRK